MLTIVSLTDRPDLLADVARWQWEEWGRKRGRPLEAVADEVAPLTQPGSDEAGFVLLDGGVPVGTACLTKEDLDSRPDLTPWLASVYVDPAHRRKGHAARLVRAVEDEAVRRGHATLWLFTWTTASLYAALGWDLVGPAEHRGSAVTLMRRTLIPAQKADRNDS